MLRRSLFGNAVLQASLEQVFSDPLSGRLKTRSCLEDFAVVTIPQSIYQLRLSTLLSTLQLFSKHNIATHLRAQACPQPGSSILFYQALQHTSVSQFLVYLHSKARTSSPVDTLSCSPFVEAHLRLPFLKHKLVPPSIEAHSCCLLELLVSRPVFFCSRAP